jgi:hypothetical protein
VILGDAGPRFCPRRDEHGRTTTTGWTGRRETDDRSLSEHGRAPRHGRLPSGWVQGLPPHIRSSFRRQPALGNRSSDLFSFFAPNHDPRLANSTFSLLSPPPPTHTPATAERAGRDGQGRTDDRWPANPRPRPPGGHRRAREPAIAHHTRALARTLSRWWGGRGGAGTDVPAAAI